MYASNDKICFFVWFIVNNTISMWSSEIKLMCQWSNFENTSICACYTSGNGNQPHDFAVRINEKRYMLMFNGRRDGRTKSERKFINIALSDSREGWKEKHSTHTHTHTHTVLQQFLCVGDLFSNLNAAIDLCVWGCLLSTCPHFTHITGNVGTRTHLCSAFWCRNINIFA